MVGVCLEDAEASRVSPWGSGACWTGRTGDPTDDRQGGLGVGFLRWMRPIGAVQGPGSPIRRSGLGEVERARFSLSRAASGLMADEMAADRRVKLPQTLFAARGVESRVGDKTLS